MNVLKGRCKKNCRSMLSDPLPSLLKGENSWKKVTYGMAAKRKLEEFDVYDFKACDSAIVHGVMTELSPVKKSERDDNVKHFSGQICDGKSSVRVFSFEPALRRAMCKSMENKDSTVPERVRENAIVSMEHSSK